MTYRKRNEIEHLKWVKIIAEGIEDVPKDEEPFWMLGCGIVSNSGKLQKTRCGTRQFYLDKMQKELMTS